MAGCRPDGRAGCRRLNAPLGLWCRVQPSYPDRRQYRAQPSCGLSLRLHLVLDREVSFYTSATSPYVWFSVQITAGVESYSVASSTSTRWLILEIMPRKAGESTCTTVWFRRRMPNACTVAFWRFEYPIGLLTSVIRTIFSLV